LDVRQRDQPLLDEGFLEGRKEAQVREIFHGWGP
jgi:hypothetical protein